MSSIKLTANSGGGTFEIKAPSSGSNARILTVPDETGTLLTSATSTGKVLQIVSTTKNDQYTETISNGAQSSNNITGLTVSITPSNASNKIFLSCTLSISGDNIGFNFFKDGSVISGATGDADGTKKRVFGEAYTGNYRMMARTFTFLDTAGGTSAITYSVRLQNTSTFNNFIAVNTNVSGRSAVNGYDMVGASTITAMEVAA